MSMVIIQSLSKVMHNSLDVWDDFLEEVGFNCCEQTFVLQHSYPGEEEKCFLVITPLVIKHS